MEHRALRVLRGWIGDPLYQAASGRPTDLPVSGEGRTFASLVRAYAGDVTTMAVLRELERLKAVVRSRTGQLRARPENWKARMRTTARFRDFSRLLADFSDTTAQLIAERDSPLFFGFKELEVTTSAQAERFKHSFGRRASLLLDGVEHWQMRQTGKVRKNKGEQKGSAQRIGLGVYLVHRSHSADVSPARKR
jgi:hypothetical protein